MPSNQHSEKVVLGELLLNNACWERVKVLTVDDFSLTSHQRIFACIAAHLTRKRAIDPILLVDAMKRQKEDVDASYISDLTTDTCRGTTLGEHLRLLREKTRLRMLMEMAHNASQMAQDEAESGGTAKSLSEALQRLPRSI